MVRLSWGRRWFQFCVLCRRRFRCGGLSPISRWWVRIDERVVVGPAGVPTCGGHRLIPAGWTSARAAWREPEYEDWLARGVALNRALRIVQRKTPTYYISPMAPQFFHAR